MGPWFRVLAALVETQVWFPALLWSLIPTCSSSFKGTDSWLLRTPELACVCPTQTPHIWYTYIHEGKNTHTCKIDPIKKKKKNYSHKRSRTKPGVMVHA